MHWQEIGDWFVRAVVAFGVPGLLGKYFYDYRKGRPNKRQLEAEADVAEQTTTVKVRSASVTGLEGQMLAMEKGFDIERTSMESTIDHLTSRLQAEREYSASRDLLITELRAQVEKLRSELDGIAVKLKALQNDGH